MMMGSVTIALVPTLIRMSVNMKYVFLVFG